MRLHDARSATLTCLLSLVIVGCGASAGPASSSSAEPSVVQTPSATLTADPTSTTTQTPTMVPAVSQTTPTPSASPGSTPTPQPQPTSVAAGPATVVFGTESCRGITPATEAQGVETLHGRDATMECVDNVSDPRVSGTVSLTFNYEAWTTDLTGGWVGVQWGDVKLEQADGAWTGFWSGVIYPGLRDDVAIWYRGSGAYDGLVYTAHASGSLGDYQLEGLIYPGEFPPVL